MSKTYSKSYVHKGAIIRRRGTVYQVEINVGGKRIRKTYDTLGEAESYIDKKQAELTNEGVRALSLTEDQRLDASKALPLLPLGATLESAVKDYADALKHLEGPP